MDVRNILSALAGAFALLLMGVGPASAADAVDQLTVSARLEPDGTLLVEQRFEGVPAGQITQRIATAAPVSELRTARYRISDLTVEAPGAPAARVEETAEAVAYSFEAPEGTATVRYRVSGATSKSETAQDITQFSWPLVQPLNVEVQTVTGDLRFVAPPPDFDCQAGDPAALHNCALWSIDREVPEAATFEDGPLKAGETLNVAGSQPRSIVAVTAQIDSRWTLDRAFSLTWATGAAAAGTLLLGGAALWLWHRRMGRDDLAARPTVVAEFHPIGEGLNEFRLVSGVRPGQIGTVADESVDPLDITATILDLAVRGYLVIEQIDSPGGTDWRLTPTGKPGEDLRPYEKKLLEAAAPAEGTLVSGIQAAVGPVLYDVQHELYRDVVTEGWFVKHPRKARTDSRMVGGVLLVIGVLTTGLLGWLTTWGLVGLAVLAVGVASLFVAGEMSRRSVAGAELLSGLNGFSAILAQQRTDCFPAGRELEQISKLLPYAVVLGGKERWIEAMVDADADDQPDPDAISWYRAPDNWHLAALPHSLDALIASIQGHLFGR